MDDDLDLDRAEAILRQVLIAEMRPQKWRAEMGAALLAGDDELIAALTRHLSGNLAQGLPQLIHEVQK